MHSLRSEAYLATLSAFLFLVLPIAALWAQSSHDRSQPKIIPSVMVFTEYQIKDFPKLVEQVLATKPPAVNVVLTSQVLLNPDMTIKQFGMVRAKEGSPFEPWTDQSREATRQLLTEGFRKIRDAGIPLTILPHVDATGDLQDWRNNFIFDPQAKIDGVSYADYMIDDVMESLDKAGMQDSPIHFNLAGEMGQTLYESAASYNAIAERLRAKYPWKHLQIGIGLNHGSVFGKSVISEKASADFQELLENVDFLGISCYHRVNVPVTANDFEIAIEDYMKELTAAGVKVPESLPIHFGELGLGGNSARLQDTMTNEEQVALIASEPWYGVSDGQSNPWAKPHLKAFRQDYYDALISFLENQKGPYHVEEVALWSMGSWCPHGFLIAHSRDEEIVSAIDAFNAKSSD